MLLSGGLGKKQLNILKGIADKCQPVSGEMVIRFAVANWLKFTAQAKIDDAFGFAAPQKPSMTFLSTHVATAVTMATMQEPSKQQEALVTNSTDPSVQLPSPLS